MTMRKVGVAEGPLEGKVGLFTAELESNLRRLEALASSGGLEAVAGSREADRVAQYSEVVRILGAAGEDLDAWAAGVALEARDVLRSGDAPRWRLLAHADVLDVLAECLSLRGQA